MVVPAIRHQRESSEGTSLRAGFHWIGGRGTKLWL
jgi:hypothetical protein